MRAGLACVDMPLCLLGLTRLAAFQVGTINTFLHGVRDTGVNSFSVRGNYVDEFVLFVVEGGFY